jgi:hypothetical protein
MQIWSGFANTNVVKFSHGPNRGRNRIPAKIAHRDRRPLPKLVEVIQKRESMTRRTV